MTKEELIDLVKLNVTGGDAPAELKSRYSPQEIEKYLEMAFDDMVYQTYLDGYKTGDFSQVDNYMLSYIFDVQYNDDRDQYFVELIPQPIPLPDNFSIRQISLPKDQTLPFAPVDNVSASVWAELEADYVSPVIGYSVEAYLVYFDNKFPRYMAKSKIMVKQIVPFSALEDNNSVFVTGGNNMMLVQKVIQMLLGKPQPDAQGSNMNTKQI